MNVLSCDCGISEAFNPNKDGDMAPSVTSFPAIWDTGATGSVITQKVVDACGLIATGMAQVHGVHGTEQVPTYLINIYLPNTVVFAAQKVALGYLKGADILIGMSIISQGDFAVTNEGGITCFSFRYPPDRHIDFTAEIEFLNKQNSRKNPNRRKTPRGRKRR